MKIGVISDTHSLLLPPALLEALKNVDLIIHAGDICDVETINLLKKIAPLKAVCGNMDLGAIKTKLPLKEFLEVEDVRIGICHGHGLHKEALANAQAAFDPKAVDVVIFGHSHKAYNERIGGVLYFNPGSPNDVVKASFFSYGLLEITGGKLKSKIIRL